MDAPTTVLSHPFRLFDSLQDRLGARVSGPARRRAVFLFAAVLALDGADKATLGAVAAELKPDLHIGNAQLGVLASTTTAMSALATLPMGVLADRVTRVRLLTLSVVLWSVAMAAGAAAGSFETLLLSRLALGAVLATAGPVIASLVGDIFEPGERARIYGYVLSGELVGSGLGFLVSGDVAGLLSWRASFVVLALVGVLLAWVLWRRLREPERSGEGNQVRGEDPVRMPLRRALRYVLSVRTNVVVILATASGYFFFAGLRTFGVVFARGHFALTQSVASTLFTLTGTGALVGVLLGGRLADAWTRRGRENARVLVAIIGFGVAGVLLLPGLLTTSLALAMPLYFVGAAAFSAPNPPLDAVRLDVMPARLWGRAEGLRTVVRTLAEAGAPLAFGLVAGALGGSGTRHHAAGVRDAFLIALVPLALNGLILLRALKTYPHDAAAAATFPAARRPGIDRW